MFDYYVYLVKLPRAVEGFVTPNDDDSYTIYINSEMPAEKRTAALKHELEHIKRGHLYSDKPLSVIEAEADGKAANIFALDDMIPEFLSLDALKHWAIKKGKGAVQ